jgi:murein DD-endopeptidase MepM/ murein hydrolase activator NlpD
MTRAAVRIHLSLLVLMLAALAAACAAPADPPRPGAAATDRSDIALPSEMQHVSARVAPGATLTSLLEANDVAAPDIVETVAQARSVFDLRKVRTSQPYRVEKRANGSLARFEYEIDGDQLLRVERSDAALVAALVPIAKTRRVEVVRGGIDRETPSLFDAIDESGETSDLAVALADILGGDIDFNSVLQTGDRFGLLVEKQYREDDQNFGGYGPIFAAELDNVGRRVRALRFTPDGGKPGYYDEKGVSLRRFFLRSPLKFEPVVTSPFSRRRFHPILRRYRAHLGVDYRAPIGAPVVAVADGVVVDAGMRGGAGRLVHLRHTHGFESEYLHLSKINVRKGAHVRQGDVIGRVGASGLATGPHLDYRLKRGGAFVDPRAVHRAMPPADPVPPGQMAEFIAARDRVFAKLGAPGVLKAAATRTAGAPQQQ